MALNPHLREYAANMYRAAVAHGDVAHGECCEQCGRDPVANPDLVFCGHYEDYALPLHVEWLCSACHATRHPKIRKNPVAKKIVRHREPTRRANELQAIVLRHRRNTGETQDSMARRCGVNVLLINRICRGHCQRHNQATVAAIMRGLGLGDAS